MTTAMPVLETERLTIRPLALDDLHTAHQITADAGWVDPDLTPEQALAQRREWLEWAVRNTPALARLYQPPYGDRAVVLKSTNQMIGMVGLVPTAGPFGQLPFFAARDGHENRRSRPEFGLFWALLGEQQGKGFATEAARALVEYAFNVLQLRQIVATTDFDNSASQRVMLRLGMTIDRNPYPEPEWLQIVGILDDTMFAKQQLIGMTAQVNLAANANHQPEHTKENQS